MATSIAAALCDPECYPHPCGPVELIETHISWVLLAGPYAYKIKKPVNLGFLDFSTLEARRRCCEAELALNRRTAPALYLEVVAVTGSAGRPRIGAEGEPIDYAVKMRRFPREALLEDIARRGEIEVRSLDLLGVEIAAFHARAQAAVAGSDYGSPETIAADTLDNFEEIVRLGCEPSEAARISRLRRWSEDGLARLAPVFAARRAAGRVRECHGDLHLGNIALVDGVLTPFDCIEFNEAFRYIDVMSEVAFLVMDLEKHGLTGFASRLLNVYLEESGDYAGIAVLRHYLVYRAMVRAKVARIRARQDGREVAASLEHVRLAERLTVPGEAQLLLMHGVSGSGKTTVSQRLLEKLGAVRVRSDVERKRLFGLRATARSRSAFGEGIYGGEASRATYARLAQAARGALAAGWPAIVDAAFLRRSEREDFRRLAQELRVPMRIVDCRAPLAVLRARIAAREREARDASEADLAVLERQLAAEEPLGEQELREALSADSIT
ncbi:MAG: AAA family ATPase [Burkholderiales bacterium]|nr:AAA family ATPase [Burkholderiales bacterium]